MMKRGILTQGQGGSLHFTDPAHALSALILGGLFPPGHDRICTSTVRFRMFSGINVSAYTQRVYVKH